MLERVFDLDDGQEFQHNFGFEMRERVLNFFFQARCVVVVVAGAISNSLKRLLVTSGSASTNVRGHSFGCKVSSK